MPEVDFDSNVTALYDAIGRSDWDAASTACVQNPREAETWVVRRDNADEDGDTAPTILWRFLPLHSACARRPPAAFVRALLRAYPDAASLKDESGMYPLHYACGNRASREVIALLVEAFPRAARESDPQGMLPLHYVTQWGPSEEGILELLLEAYADGVAVLNGEEMSPLDLCREGNFEGWADVLEVLERQVKKNQRWESSHGGGSQRAGRKLEVSVPRGEDSLLSSTIEVPRSAKSTQSSSRARRERSSSRSRRERSLSQSRRSSSRSRGGKAPSRFDARDETVSARSQRSAGYSDARDETSTPRSYHADGPTTPRRTATVASRSIEGIDRSGHSFGSARPHSISCSIGSPRYHEMKTPRSSGRGPGFHFGGPKTPRSSRSAGRSVEFFEENESSIPSHGSGTASQESSHQLHGILHRPSNEKHDATHHAMQGEIMDLRAKLASYETIQHENARLQTENARLHLQLGKLQDIQMELSGIVDISEQRENTRLQASAERRKMLLDWLAEEERQDHAEKDNFLYRGETLGRALRRQIVNMEGLRRELVMGAGGSGSAMDLQNSVGYAHSAFER